MIHRLDICYNKRDFNINGAPKSMLTLPYNVAQIIHEIDKTPIYLKKNIQTPSWEEHYNRPIENIPLNIHGFNLFKKLYFNQAGFIIQEDCYGIKDRDKMTLEFFDCNTYSYNSKGNHTIICKDSTRFQFTEIFYFNKEIEKTESCNDENNYKSCYWHYITYDNLKEVRAIVIFEKLFDSTLPELKTVIYFDFLSETNVNVLYCMPHSKQLFWEDLIFDKNGFLHSIKTYRLQCEFNFDPENIESLFSEIKALDRNIESPICNLTYEYLRFDSNNNWTELLIQGTEWVDFEKSPEIHSDSMYLIERQIEYFD